MDEGRQYVEEQVKLLPRADLEQLAMSAMVMGAEALAIVQNAQDFGDDFTDDLIEYYEGKGLL